MAKVMAFGSTISEEMARSIQSLNCLCGSESTSLISSPDLV